VFIGGSRKVVRLAPEVRIRLDRIVAGRLPVIVGDANGADKAVQQYLSGRGHAPVEVFCSDPAPRNNIGAWPVRVVRPDHSRKDFDYYATKDRAMATEATVGLMLWDGKSHGTLMNVLRLAAAGKPVVIHVEPEKSFVEIRTSEDLTAFLAGLGADSNKRLRADAVAEGLSRELEQASLGLG
jgi:adenine-specific DNA-methyltransferase